MPAPFRISVTDIDSVAYWSQWGDGETKSLVDRLLHIDPPSDEMLAGNAFHKAIEEFGSISSMGVYLEMRGMRYQIHDQTEETSTIPRPNYTEVKFVKEIGDDAVLVGKVDGGVGTTFLEYKTVFKTISLEKFIDSFQWKAYLYLGQEMQCGDFFIPMEKVEFHVFKIKMSDLEPPPDRPNLKGKMLLVQDHKLISMNLYDGLYEEVERKVRSHVDMLKSLESSGYVARNEKGQLVKGENYDKLKVANAG